MKRTVEGFVRWDDDSTPVSDAVVHVFSSGSAKSVAHRSTGRKGTYSLTWDDGGTGKERSEGVHLTFEVRDSGGRLLVSTKDRPFLMTTREAQVDLVASASARQSARRPAAPPSGPAAARREGGGRGPSRDRSRHRPGARRSSAREAGRQADRGAVAPTDPEPARAQSAVRHRHPPRDRGVDPPEEVAARDRPPGGRHPAHVRLGLHRADARVPELHHHVPGLRPRRGRPRHVRDGRGRPRQQSAGRARHAARGRRADVRQADLLLAGARARDVRQCAVQHAQPRGRREDSSGRELRGFRQREPVGHLLHQQRAAGGRAVRGRGPRALPHGPVQYAGSGNVAQRHAGGRRGRSPRMLGRLHEPLL